MDISLEDIDVFIFDFDGVLTNNLVYLNFNEEEFVSCSRADGLAFDVLNKLKKTSFILSTEKNQVVEARARKLKVPVWQNATNKVDALKKIVDENEIDLQRVLYVGNDLNDYHAMKICGLTVCPADSHPKIKKISDICLNTNGGNGIVRELLEEVLNLDFVKILYED